MLKHVCKFVCRIISWFRCHSSILWVVCKFKPNYEWTFNGKVYISTVQIPTSDLILVYFELKGASFMGCAALWMNHYWWGLYAYRANPIFGCNLNMFRVSWSTFHGSCSFRRLLRFFKDKGIIRIAFLFAFSIRL